MNAVVDNNGRGSNLSFENEEEFGRRFRNLRSTYGSKERPISLDSSDDDDDETSSDESLIEVVVKSPINKSLVKKSPLKKRLSFSGGNEKIVKTDVDLSRKENSKIQNTDNLLDINSLKKKQQQQSYEEEQIKKKVSFNNLNALRPNPKFDLLKRRCKFDTCCIQCLKSKREIYCDRFKSCNVCSAKKKKCEFSIIAKIDHSFDNLNVNDIKSNAITSFVKSNSLLIKENKSLSSLIKEHKFQKKVPVNSTEELNLKKDKFSDVKEKPLRSEEKSLQMNCDDSKKKKKKKKKKRKEFDEALVSEKKRRKESDETLVSEKKEKKTESDDRLVNEKKKRKDSDEILVSDKKKKKKKRKRELDDNLVCDKKKEENLVSGKKNEDNSVSKPKGENTLFTEPNMQSSEFSVFKKNKLNESLPLEKKLNKKLELKEFKSIDNYFNKSSNNVKASGNTDAFESDSKSSESHKNVTTKIGTIDLASNKNSTKIHSDNNSIVACRNGSKPLSIDDNSKSKVLKAEPKSMKNVQYSPVKNDNIILNIKDLSNDLSDLSCSDTSDSSDSSEDEDKADDEFSDNEKTSNSKIAQKSFSSFDRESTKSKDLMYSRRVMAQLESLDFESRDIYSMFDNTGPRRKRRRATKQDYKLHDDSDYENNVYDNNGEVILSEEEQDKRLLNGQVDDEFLANIEEPLVGPTAINQSSEDEFSD